jgi:hypothetical protein
MKAQNVVSVAGTSALLLAASASADAVFKVSLPTSTSSFRRALGRSGTRNVSTPA